MANKKKATVEGILADFDTLDLQDSVDCFQKLKTKLEDQAKGFNQQISEAEDNIDILKTVVEVTAK